MDLPCHPLSTPPDSTTHTLDLMGFVSPAFLCCHLSPSVTCVEKTCFDGKNSDKAWSPAARKYFPCALRNNITYRTLFFRDEGITHDGVGLAFVHCVITSVRKLESFLCLDTARTHQNNSKRQTKWKDSLIFMVALIRGISNTLMCEICL